MIYKIAEKFKSVQGEGVYAGTPMAFIRFVGCSVGKTICQHCDTDFDRTLEWRGGGDFTVTQLFEWLSPYSHVCLTGGEPLDQDLSHLFDHDNNVAWHIETSGTKPIPEYFAYAPTWICVSPKPGFLEETITVANEVKVIVPGLGDINEKNPKHWLSEEAAPGHFVPQIKRWPTLSDALRWAAAGKIVFLQPRNAKNDIDKQNLLYCQDLVREYPQLRLSVQLHKVLRVQ